MGKPLLAARLRGRGRNYRMTDAQAPSDWFVIETDAFNRRREIADVYRRRLAKIDTSACPWCPMHARTTCFVCSSSRVFV
jgi:hypothetical protein